MGFTNLDMDALRSYVLGVEAGSFAQAADRLGRSTSAVSSQLKKLEEQAGVALVRKVGRGLVPTDSGESLLSYARRLLDLNDEAIAAVRGVELEGWVRLGLQEDFGETVLPQVLGRFARAHPKVRIEGRIGRNKDLVEMVTTGRLDLALAWDDGFKRSAPLASLPLCWLGSAETPPAWQVNGGELLPLVALEAPCTLRAIACEQLDRLGISWRLAFVSPSLAGLWAATAAGLGISLRTPIGWPSTIRILDPVASHLPVLPKVGLVLYRAQQDLGPTAEHLATIVERAIREILPFDWLANR